MDREGQYRTAHGTALRWGRRLSWEELRFLCHELESITRAGFPMVPALASLARDMKSTRLKAVLEQVQHDLQRGESLEAAIQRQDERFPPLMLALLRAGERTGNLAGILGLMSQHARTMCRVTQAMRTALIYPMVLALTAMAVLGYLLIWVVPPFQETFAALNVPLPGPTQAIFRISDFFVKFGRSIAIIAGAGLVFLPLLARWVVPLERRHHLRGAFLLRLPWYGRIYHAILETRFCRTLHLLLSSRVPAVDAVVLSGAATGNPLAECAAREAAERVGQGGRLSDSLAATRFFSHKTCWLIGAGEDRGGVEDALEHIAENLEREIQASEQAFGMLAAPILTVLVAGVAGLFLIALYVPLYNTGQGLGVE